MKILFVSSKELPVKWDLLQNEITISRSYDSTIQKLKKYDYDIIDLDLDLEDVYSGKDIIRFLLNNEIQVQKIYLHSDDQEKTMQVVKMIHNYSSYDIQFDFYKNL